MEYTNIDRKDWDIWDTLTFKTTSYHKNFDFVNDGESLITEHTGTISLIRLADYKPPLIIGEFDLSIWNIGLGKKMNCDLKKLIKEHKNEDTYDELIKIINNKDINIINCEKLILINSLIVCPDYRKRGITEEFIEMLYRVFYNENNLIIALIKPIQDNFVDADIYFKRKMVEFHPTLENYLEIEVIPAVIYYSLEELRLRKDKELNEYKLFSVASKCGFNRIDDSYLFMFSPDKIFERIKEKREYFKVINNKLSYLSKK